ncbi:sterile alpha motif domain-containing protein 9-like [Astyanax mexicanus]|uniref:sterile alpha motif domain-containing protein 9-like n=1 Tax=Astyanax mexicanus TaxID=7994 RepID=UPI0020CAF8B9|nr:sterile alpha motif domain-containing protein 9-like [Astyanax mexicanus]
MEVYTVPSKQGTPIPLQTSIRDGLSMLEVVWANKFEDESISQETAIEKEAEFYKGAPPQWLNFYWAEREKTPFVKRDMYERIRKEINENKRTSWSIASVNLLHQPGSGGSTLAMQILWDLRKGLRCARVTHSATDSKAVAQQVVQLFNAGGPQNQNTVLLLLDNSHDSVSEKNLKDSLIKELKASCITPDVPVAIILNCVRQLKVTKIRVLETSLSKREEEAFKEKHNEIVQRHGDRRTRFHALNIMSSNYSTSYVTEACEILQTIKKNKRPRKEQLLAFLALVNAYAPGSYIAHDLCCQFFDNESNDLDEFSLEKQMQPFTDILVIFSTQEGENRSEDKHVRMAHPMIAGECLELLTSAGVTRSDTTLKLLTDLCRDPMPMYLVKIIKRMLTKRETIEVKDNSERQEYEESEGQDKDKSEKKAKFSRLIEDIKEKEREVMCVSVLKKASRKFDRDPFLPQALARFYYIEMTDYEKAEEWATIAIKRDEDNSYIRDTLGQVHKNHLKKCVQEKTCTHTTILQIGNHAIKAFKEEAKAAIKEQAPEMKEDGVTNVSALFNSSGYFSYMQVATTIFNYIENHDRTLSKVLTKEISPPISFNSCETFLTDLRDEVEQKFEFFETYLTYSKPSIDKDEPGYFRPDVEECYSKYVTQEHGQENTELQALKEQKVSTFAGLLHALNRPSNESDLEWATRVLKSSSDDDSVLKYVLANILLAQRNSSSKELKPLEKLQSLLKEQWSKEKYNRSPEFYLLVLLLFWPNGEQVEDDSPDIAECIEFMHQSFGRTYQSFFRSRYLVPLFFLKAGEGLQKVLHTSQLDKSLLNQINKRGDSANISNLLRVQGEVQHFQVFAVEGSRKIKVSPQNPASVCREGQISFYLGFNIRGPVAYNIRYL